MEYPESVSSVYFVRLRLKRGEDLISENIYWRGTKEDDLTALRTLPIARLGRTTKAEREGNIWHVTTELVNNTHQIVPMVKLKVVGDNSGERILPVIYSDNFVTLMPGEKRIIKMEFQEGDTRGEKPEVVVEGYHIE
jgi:hypothetical protein